MIKLLLPEKVWPVLDEVYLEIEANSYDADKVL